MRSALGAVLVYLLWFLCFPSRSVGTSERNPRTRTTTTTRTIEDEDEDDDDDEDD